MTSTPRTVGFVGAGQLGEPTVMRLLETGHRVRVYARRDDVRSRLADRGAIVVDSVAEAAAADLVVLFVFSDDQLREVALGPAGVIAAMSPGTPLAIHTTASLPTLDALAAAAAAAGATVMDAPVSGTAEDIAAGKLTVLVGGDAAAVETASQVFRCYADPVVSTGDLGSAMKTKLVNNVLFAANMQLVGDAIRLAESLGIEPAAAIQALMACSGGSKAMGYLAAFGNLDGFAASAAPYLRKDVAAARASAAEQGADLGLLGVIATSGPLDLA